MLGIPGSLQPFFKSPLSIILLVALAARMITWKLASVINPDSVLYLAQAQSIFQGQWSQAITCGYLYLTNYSLFISAVYPLTQDWIASGRIVSFVMGTFFVVPIYFLLRFFFNLRISAITTLCYAVIPIFVSRSVDIVRGPTCWFFLALGIYFYVYACKKQKLFFILASLSLIMAAWARVESIVYFIICLIFILVAPEKGKLKKFFLFLSPVFFLSIVAVALSLGFQAETVVSHHLSATALQEHWNALVLHNDYLKEAIATLSANQEDLRIHSFLQEAGRARIAVTVWMIINRYSEAFTYSYFALAVVGFYTIKKCSIEPFFIYLFATLAFVATLIMYQQINRMWVLEYRYTGIFILACPLFLAQGIELILTKVLGLRHQKGLGLAVLTLFLFAAPVTKAITQKLSSDSIYITIGKAIARHAKDFPAYTVSSAHSIRLVSLYSNLQSPIPLCDIDSRAYSSVVTGNYPELSANLMAKDIRFLLWEENYWPADKEEFLAQLSGDKNFKQIGSWHHVNAGHQILFQFDPYATTSAND